MNVRSIKALAQKDLREVQVNRSVWVPLLIVPLIFIVLLPIGVIYLPAQTQLLSGTLGNPQVLSHFAQRLPAALGQSLAGLTEAQRLVVLILGYMLAPLFLMFPLMASTTIASESFAGERERKTIEALLYTPATDGELFLGKVLAGFIPSLIVTWVSFLVYALVVNLAGYGLMGRIWFPLPGWWPLIFWIAPALALVGVSVTVLISSRAKSFMESYQMSASLVVVVLALVAAQISGVLYFTVSVGLIVGLVFWAAALLLLAVAIRVFRRRALIQNVG